MSEIFRLSLVFSLAKEISLDFGGCYKLFIPSSHVTIALHVYVLYICFIRIKFISWKISLVNITSTLQVMKLMLREFKYLCHSPIILMFKPTPVWPGILSSFFKNVLHTALTNIISSDIFWSFQKRNGLYDVKQNHLKIYI